MVRHLIPTNYCAFVFSKEEIVNNILNPFFTKSKIIRQLMTTKVFFKLVTIDHPSYAALSEK